MYKKEQGKKSPDAVETILGKGATFEGNVSCEGSIRIEGTLKGDAKIDSTLVVGSNGSVIGNVNAKGVIVFGEVNGKIDAGSLEIKNAGKITGEIVVETLITEAGGIMKAKCEMKNPAKQDSENQVLSVSYFNQ